MVLLGLELEMLSLALLFGFKATRSQSMGAANSKAGTGKGLQGRSLVDELQFSST